MREKLFEKSFSRALFKNFYQKGNKATRQRARVCALFYIQAMEFALYKTATT